MGTTLSDEVEVQSCFHRERHVAFMEMMYEVLPYHYQTQEINRLTLAHFVVSGLHILRALHRIDKDSVVSWVLSFQAVPSDLGDANDGGQFYGFNGSCSSQFPEDKDRAFSRNHSHLASTYCALAILKLLDFDFSKIDSKSIAKSLSNLQKPDGSFQPIHIGAETDLRFVYCAAAICSMLDDWSGFDKEKAKDYILKCQSFDGGFGMTPGSESHGGGTYLAVASLRLMGYIEDDMLSKSVTSSMIDVQSLLEWCLQRQAADGGFQGRSNKPSDTCYAFWVGAVLKILGGYELINRKGLRRFLLTCQSKYGGFSKFPNEWPDLYHSYYGYTAFSLLEEPGLAPLSVQLGIPDISSLSI